MQHRIFLLFVFVLGFHSGLFGATLSIVQDQSGVVVSQTQISHLTYQKSGVSYQLELSDGKLGGPTCLIPLATLKTSGLDPASFAKLATQTNANIDCRIAEDRAVSIEFSIGESKTFRE